MWPRRLAFSLLEIAIVLGALAIMAAAVSSAVAGRREQAMARRAVQDAQEIAAAAERYYWRTGSWPPGLAALVPDDLPASVLQGNPWGKPWTLTTSPRRVAVSTVIPSSRLPSDVGSAVEAVPVDDGLRIAVSRPLDAGGGTYAIYEKRHLYLQ